jgi:hypothetical protein
MELKEENSWEGRFSDEFIFQTQQSPACLIAESSLSLFVFDEQ